MVTFAKKFVKIILINFFFSNMSLYILVHVADGFIDGPEHPYPFKLDSWCSLEFYLWLQFGKKK